MSGDPGSGLGPIPQSLQHRVFGVVFSCLPRWSPTQGHGANVIIDGKQIIGV